MASTTDKEEPKQEEKEDATMSTNVEATTQEPEKTTADPASVLATTTRARTLTLSDQHANILLTVNNDKNNSKNDDSSSSSSGLLKLTLVPFHKTDLACLPPEEDAAKDQPNKEKETKARSKQELRQQEELEHSTKVLTFLSQWDWRMTSESGAEYSYHEAVSKQQRHADEEMMGDPDAKRCKTNNEQEAKKSNTDKATSTSSYNRAVFHAELIYPASEKQVQRALPSPGLVMITETPELYKFVTEPYVDSVVESGSLSWIQNITQVKKEKERLLHNANGWILNIDTKWRTHPDPFTVQRSEWYQHESVVDLYCLAIVKQDGITSLRDLTADHLPLLREILEQGAQVIEEIYGVTQNQLRIFVHYQPQFYHFHVHFTRLENDTGVQAERAHLLSDIIQDLEHDSDYFQKRTMMYKLSLKDKLYKLMDAHHCAEKKKDESAN